MLRRSTFVLPLLPIAARAQEQTPKQFLEAIYEPYTRTGFKGQPYWEARRFFVPDLAQAIERDFAEARKRNEVPTLDGDPFIDAQDWQITDLLVGAASATPKTTGTVAFLNFGKPRTLALFLEKTDLGWRIKDIFPGGARSLRALYKLK